MASPGKKRGRPRAFDEDDVVAAILDVFWSQGYARTSLDDIARATGVHRPSLYASFGDKKAMYLRALESFTLRLGARARAALFAGGSLREDLMQFYRVMIDIHTEDAARGCPVLTVSVGDAVELPEVRALLRGMLAGIDQRLCARVARDLDAERAERLGRVLTTLLAGLAVRARAGEPRDRLEAVAEATVALVVDDA